MSQRISKIMSHHFRFTGCTTGKVHHHDVIVGIRMNRLHERSSIGNTFLEILESFRHARSDAYHMFQCRTIRHRFNNVISNNLFTCTDNRLDIRCIATINDVFLCKQVSRRNCYCTQFMQSDDREPKFNTTLQNQHHHVAMANAETLKIRSGSIGLFL